MINLLLIDDNSERVKEIKIILNRFNIKLFHAETIREAHNINRDEQNIDIIIVDLFVPQEIRYEVQSLGFQFINEIYNPGNLKRPKHTILVSSYFNDFPNKRDLLRLPVSIIDTNSDRDWKIELNKLLFKLCVYDCDIAIITAVKNEFDAIYDNNWRQELIVGGLTFYRKIYTNKDNKKISAILVQAESMGMVYAAYTMSILFKYYSPTQVFMIGIAGGNPDDTRYGDIIIAQKAYDYSYGAIKDKSQKVFGFESDPVTVSASKRLVNIFKSYSLNNLQKTIMNQIDLDMTLENDIEIKVGAMATGPAVIKSKLFVQEFIKKHYRHYVGIDMETYPIYYFCNERGDVEFLSIKSVTDYADLHKGEKYQKYCAKLSIKLLEYYIENDFIRK